jgi:hypothetical protein
MASNKRKADNKVEMVTLYCSACYAMHGTFLPKEAPKSYVCHNCGVGQKHQQAETVPFAKKRNRPLGFWS